MWNEFHAEQDALVPESEALLSQLFTGDEDASIEVLPEAIRVGVAPIGSTDTTASVKVRWGQRYFRQAALNTYGGRCAVTGMAIRELLVASHIIPWNAVEQHRLDPQNGIALNALHDKAFDRGLITFDTDLRLVCAPSIREHYATDPIAANFKAYEGRSLIFPTEAAGPNPKYLEYHRNELFGKGG